MIADFVLASIHHVLVFSLAGIIAAEWMLIRPGLTGNALGLLASIDRVYGGVAMLVLAAGFLRVFHGTKGSEFYLENPVFWTKIGLFALVGLLSVPPTLRIMRWGKARREDAGFVVPETEVQAMRRYVHAEAALFLLIPVAAAAMARGYGYI
ncbi:DUF2214 family protein [Nitratireductor mangrovi]|uniref:DUF2214 family protein n=1 Tax=Nitratireductor mangrovi TaxID=2599600 RepID=A0A5B8KWT5_9HYPH|nr:DUF2214 family protein [Nitratireductor mangrovi]QDZ00177.1 DUF2214 family protein [Nitratireductor mangrovi]